MCHGVLSAWKSEKLYEPRHEEIYRMSYANNKGTDQSAHPHSLISAFVVQYLDSIISILATFKTLRHWLASVAEQAGLSLTRL